MRMVVELSPEEIIAHLRTHLDQHGCSDIEVKVYAAFGHAQTSAQEPVIQSALKILADWQVEATLWPIEAGGGPWTAVPNMFNVPCLRGGVIGGGNRSDNNEFMVIEGDGKVAELADVEKYLVDLIYNYARTSGR